MKKILLLFPFSLMLLLGKVMSQFPEQLMVQQQFFNQYGKVYAKGSKAPDLVGFKFLDEDWRPMEIKTKDFEVRFDAVKINLYSGNLEVLYDGQEKLIYPSDFQYVSFKEDEKTRIFVPARRYRLDGKMLEGFMEVVGNGERKILVQHYTGIKEPGPSANIVGGPTDNLLVKSSKTYIYSEGKLVPVKNKKQFVQFFKGKSRKAEKLMKERKTDFKDPNQLYDVLELMAE